MQPVPVPFEEYSEDVEEQPVPSWRPSRRVFAAGAITLALTALAGASFRSGDASGASAQHSILDGVIQEVYTAKCDNPDKVCKGKIGVKGMGCKHTVNLKCCIIKNKDYRGHQWDCCLDKAYESADKKSVETCCPDVDKCDDDKCKATAKLKCALSLAKTWDERKKVCDGKLNKAKEPICVPFEEERSLGNCTEAGENCLHSRCCKDPKRTCYKKNHVWGDCRLSCKKGEIDPKSPPDLQSPWSCKVLDRCSETGEGCLETGCCKDPNMQCYMKNARWADCKTSCARGKIDKNSPKATWAPWSCDLKCSIAGEGCHKTGCCRNPALVCYEKDEKWADCRSKCDPHEIDPKSPKKMQGNWTCKVLKMKDWIPSDPTPKKTVEVDA